MSLTPDKSSTKDRSSVSNNRPTCPKADKPGLHVSTSEWNYSKMNTKTCRGHGDEVNCVAFSEDFEMMVTGSDDSLVRIFNAVTNRLLTSLVGHRGTVRAVAISSGSRLIASGSQDKTIRIWRTRDTACLFILQGHLKRVESLSFSKDSSLLCSGSWDKTAVLWSVKDGTKLKVLSEHEDLVQSSAFSFNGKYLATGSWDYAVIVWKISSPAALQNSSGETKCGDSEAISGDRLHVLRGHSGNIHAVAFSAEGMLASGSWDRTIRLWNPRSGACFFTLVGHTAWVQSVAFSSDSLFLISASEDDSIRVWNCTNGECVKQLKQTGTDSVAVCAFGPGTHEVIVVSGPAAFTLTCYNKTQSRNQQLTLE